MKNPMIAYKLVTLHADRSLSPLFINKRQRLEVGVEYEAEDHPTRGYKRRPGWHCMENPEAPHLSPKGRVWCKVKIDEWERFIRPPIQGGVWFLAKKMEIVEVLG